MYDPLGARIMRAKRFCPSIGLLLVCFGSPVLAGDYTGPWSWSSIHQEIYDRGNAIALLEANPQTDDGYRAPLISRARSEIWQLRAMLDPPQWRWTTPCCYSRPPIRVAWRTHRHHAH
jgi:hypothetical protein